MKIKTFELESELPYERQVSPKVANYGMTHLINLMGEDVIYVETGVHKGGSIANIVQRCPNIKAAYGVDFYKPNIDMFDRRTQRYTTERQTNAYQKAKRLIQSSGHKDKITLIIEDVSVAVNHFEDNSIDFLFLDHYLNDKDVEDCLPMWYNKVKVGGYFAGHDYVYDGVCTSIDEFRSNYNLTSPLSVFGAEWVWVKKENI
jgi:hypothetical protein